MTGAANPAGLVRAAARLAALQALYQMEATEESVEAVIAEFRAHRLGQTGEGTLEAADLGHFVNLVRGVVENQTALDQAIHGSLAPGWSLTRIDSILRALLRAAAHELFARPDIPARVVVNEYVEVARAFFEGEEPKFVNAVLDRLARARRPEEFGGAPA